MNSDCIVDFNCINETTKMIDSAIKREFSVLENNNGDESTATEGGGVEEEDKTTNNLTLATTTATTIITKEEIAINGDDNHTEDELTNDDKLVISTGHDELTHKIDEDTHFSANESSNDYQSEDYDEDYPATSNNNTHNDTHKGHNGDLSNDLGDSLDKGQQLSRKSDEPRHIEEPEQMRKLFIGGLDYKTSEETLKKHFDKFGEVLDCVVMREPQSKRSRGFGFVIYANSSQVDRAQEARPHEVDGREVQSKRAISREDSGKPEAQATVKKVYLGGLSDDIEESELNDYFKLFGNIMNINIVAHKDTGKRRGFAFVEYDDYDPVDKIVLKKFHTIKDKRIEAKKAIPKIEMDARKRGVPGMNMGPGGGDLRAAMAGSMIAMPGPPLDGMPMNGSGRQRMNRNGGGANMNNCFWDSYAGDYIVNLDAGYPPHPSQYNGAGHHHHGHYGVGGGSGDNWMAHGGGQAGPYGLRSNYGRNSYANQGSWTASEYSSGYPASPGGSGGGAGPMRLSYQHRSWGPYGSGYGTGHRGRGYNP